jgi:hypothetical protein
MLAYITPVGEHGLYQIHEVHGRTDPGYGHGGGLHPSQGLPGHGHPDQGLPGMGGHPDNALPGSGLRPSQLPSYPPPHVQQGATLVMVRDPAGVWHFAAIPPGQPAPMPLPVPPPTAAPKM